MKFATVTIFSILVAIGYGVLFSYMYPLVPIDGGLVGLWTILGLATSLMALPAWRFLAKAAHSTKNLLMSNASSKISNSRQYFYASSEPGARGRTTAAKIFISYRRDDSAGYAGRVMDRLVREFGGDLLFMDVDTIPLGANFVKVLREAVAKCDVLLAVIGRNWIDVTDDDGNRKLDNPEDPVRIEVGVALKRDIPVVPILLDGAKIPKVTRLPGDLKELAARHGLDVRHASFRSDVDKLIKWVKTQTRESEQPKTDDQTTSQVGSPTHSVRFTSSDGLEIFINPESVSAVCKLLKPQFTRLQLSDKQNLLVREAVPEVAKVLNEMGCGLVALHGALQNKIWINPRHVESIMPGKGMAPTQTKITVGTNTFYVIEDAQTAQTMLHKNRRP